MLIYTKDTSKELLIRRFSLACTKKVNSCSRDTLLFTRILEENGLSFSGGTLILTIMDGDDLPMPVNFDIVKNYYA